MEEERITPSKAEKYLNRNKSNRALRSGAVEKYAADMKAGKWTQCLAPIAFYEDGDVADGQHRLYAIIESGLPQSFFVVKGVSREAGLNIDTGATRSLVDNAHIAGKEGISHMMIAYAIGVSLGNRASYGGLSNSQKLTCVDKHHDAVRFAVDHGAQGRLLRNAPVNSAIARAWYHEEDKERLTMFGTVLSKGFANGDEDSAAIAMRNYLMSHNGATASGQWRDTFLKVQHAVWMFMRRRRLLVIKTQSTERYPLPKGKK